MLIIILRVIVAVICGINAIIDERKSFQIINLMLAFLNAVFLGMQITKL